MRNRVYIAIVVMALVSLFAASTAKAQSSGRLFIANIPFEFEVGKVTLPAGEYTVSQVAPGSDQTILRLRSKDGRAIAVVHMSPVIGKAQDRAMLIFHCYGNQYFFAEAWTVGETTGLQAPRSRTERATQRELAGLKPRIEGVALDAGNK